MKRAHLFTLLLVLAATACTVEPRDDGDDADGESPQMPSQPGGWYRPDAEASWQWQIEGALNASYDVDVYDIDTFESDASVIAELHASGRKVICYFSAGSFEPWRHDAAEYPAAAIGKPLDGWPDERWVDIRSEAVRLILAARLDLAASKGCDGVEPDNVTAYNNDSGFPLTADDQLDFNRWLADQAHARGLAAGLKNDGDQAADLAPWFDFSVNEECHFYQECDQLAPFFAAGKPVFNAEYAASAVEAAALAPSLCPTAAAVGTRTIILPWDLDDAFRVACEP
jgi:hypothetical protein